MKFKPLLFLSTMVASFCCFFATHASESPKVHAQDNHSKQLFLKHVVNRANTFNSQEAGGWKILPQLFIALGNGQTDFHHLYEVILEDGTKRVYEKADSIPDQILATEKSSMLASQENDMEYFHLIKEILPSAEQIDYIYDVSGNLEFIALKNASESEDLAWMHLSNEESQLISLSSASVSQSNIAPSGTAYGWSRMTSSSGNRHRTARPGLNDNDLTTNIDIEPDGDRVGRWEAAGILWNTPVNITSVSFINGTVTKEGDGFLTANCMLQFTADGSTWTNSQWTIAPSYPYSKAASNKTYTFSGPALSGVRGVRVAGQVRTTDTSYHWIVKEVQVIGSTGSVTSFTIAASAQAGGSISPAGNVSVAQGSNLSFTIAPDAGYAIDNVTVDGVSQGSIASYTFSNVQSNHSISATFINESGCTAPPAVPTGLTSPSQTSSSVNLSWNPVSSPEGCAVTYNVYNGATLVATVSSASTVINGLSAGVTYTFAVAAKNSAGTSAKSTALSVTTINESGCVAPPAVPTGLTSPSQTSSSVNLSWNPVSAPTGCSVTYNVYNGATLVATVSSTTAVINGLSPGVTYTFTVAAKNSVGTSAKSAALSVTTSSSGDYTPQQILAAVQAHMTSSVQVNTLPHINTMTRQMNVNVYEVAPGVFAYTSSMAIDTDGVDPDPDPDHQRQTTWQDSSGAYLGAHHVPFYVLGDDCWDRTSPCKHFYYPEHDITGLQFALIFYNGKVIGSVFGDTQTGNNQTTSDNDSRELGEASVEAAILLGIPSSGTTGGVNNGVTVVIFSGPEWVVQGTNQGSGPVGSATGSLYGKAQALVQEALNTLGVEFGL